MNNLNKTLLLSAISGIVFGWISTFVNKPELKGHYLANAATVITPENNEIYNQSSINLEFKKNDNYDLLYISSKQVGFTSSGTYHIDNHGISLDEDTHEQIIPNRELSFYEKVLISEGSVLSSDSMEYVPLNDKEFLLITQFSMLHFCEKVACSELPNYAQ
ncbi:hypothetical protein EK599_18910 [Vibrio sp. T187]|uniref:hypothetical protein n=1 Tax=Vibrio TaxID=662 RepID=UPI0010CA1A08|nr:MULTISPECIES: hypothetical protein [Vibrio]MBW3697755.1 hypothetical protein [Vibrio sp. T187]